MDRPYFFWSRSYTWVKIRLYTDFKLSSYTRSLILMVGNGDGDDGDN